MDFGSDDDDFMSTALAEWEVGTKVLKSMKSIGTHHMQYSYSAVVVLSPRSISIMAISDRVLVPTTSFT